MKKIIMTLLLITLTANAGIPADKRKHALVGIGIYAGCMLVGKLVESAGYDSFLNAKTCLIPVAAAGIGKELYDRNHVNHTPEVMDAVATMAIPVGSVVLFSW